MAAPIRLLTVDLDDTLWPCRPTIQQAESELYAWLCERAPSLTRSFSTEAMRDHRRQLARDQPQIAHDFTALRRESLRRLLRAFDQREELAVQATEVFRRARNRVEPFAEVAVVLRRLRSRFVLVSVTNGNCQVEHTPLSDCFDLSLCAADVGAAKPDPALFRAAREYAGVSKTETLHVGDDPWLDVDAARRQGQRAVWVNRDGRGWPDDLDPPEAVVRDLLELEMLLDSR